MLGQDSTACPCSSTASTTLTSRLLPLMIELCMLHFSAPAPQHAGICTRPHTCSAHNAPQSPQP